MQSIIVQHHQPFLLRKSGKLLLIPQENAQKRKEPVVPYLEKDGAYITSYPPQEDGIQNAYDLSCSSDTPWKVSDHDRHAREIQSKGLPIDLCTRPHS